MPPLSDDEHAELWRICDRILSEAGARAAMVLDAPSRSILVSVGDAKGEGRVQGVEPLAPGERLVRGELGNVYGVDLPGGLLLAVLHDEGKLDAVRAASEAASHELQSLFAPPPAAPPAKPDRQPEKAKKKKAPARKKAGAAKKRAKKKVSPPPRRRARRRSTRT